MEGKTAPGATGSAGGCIVFFGLPFLGVGIGIFTMALMGSFSAESDEPRGVMLLTGGAFAASGLLVVAAGIRQLLAARYRKRQQVLHPDEPWLWDYKWDPGGAHHSAGKQTTGTFFGLLFLAIFLAPFNAVVWGGRIWFGMFIVGIFDLLLLGGVVMWIYQMLQGLKFGDSRLAFRRFPYFTGETLEAALLDTDRLRGLTKLTVTLSCFEQVQESSNGKTTQTVYSVYEDQRVFEPHEIYFGTGGAAGILKLSRKSDPLARLELAFALPEKDLSTRLYGQTSPRFWEIEVKADLPGVDYAVPFLVPVYSRRQTRASG